MPKTWFYYIALILPVVFRILLLDTGFVEWLWYHHYEHVYYWLAALRVQPQFLTFIGGWQLPVFTITVICWWQIEEGDEGIPAQFLMLPVAYVPFTIIGDLLTHWNNTDYAKFYIYPMIILPVGFVYVIVWTMFIWLLGKLKLVIS